MNRSLTLMALLLIFALAFPAAAQEATPQATPQATPAVTAQAEAALPACTRYQLNQIIAVVRLSGEIGVTTIKQSMAGYDADNQLKVLLLSEGDYEHELSFIAPNFPPCIDGTLMKNEIMQEAYREFIGQAPLLLESEFVTATNYDPNLLEATNGVLDAQNILFNKQGPGFSSYLGTIYDGQATATWLPTCTPDQLKAASQLDDFEGRWQHEVPVLAKVVQTDTVDAASYQALTAVYDDFLKALGTGIGNCADLYDRVNADLYKFGDSVMVMTLAATLPYVQNNPDFTKLETEFKNRVNAYLPPATETPGS